MNVLPFDVSPTGDAGQCGAWFWAIGLPDGRMAMCHADRLEITPAGALVLWRESALDPADPDRSARVPHDPAMVLGLAAGCWHSFHAASVLTGAPLAVDTLESL